MKILFLPKSPDATAYYRVDLPAKSLIAIGHEVRIGYLEPIPNTPSAAQRLKNEDILWAEVIVFQRPLTLPAQKLLRSLREKFPAKLLVGDYDDDYFTVPRWNPGYTFVKGYEPFWAPMYDLYDAIMVSTETLREAIVAQQISPVPVEVLCNRFDFESFDSLEPCPPFHVMATVQAPDGRAQAEYAITNEQFNELMAERTVVCWAGSRYHYVDIDYLTGVIGEVVKKNPDVVFLFVGYIQVNLFKNVPISHLFTVAGRNPASEFYRMLRGFKIDVMLAPLDPCDFNASKSNLKILEAMALGAYPVCSQFDPYEGDLEPEDEEYASQDFLPRWGTLVDYKPGLWTKSILQVAEMLNDPHLKLKARRENNRYVRSKYSLDGRPYEDFFKRHLEAKKV